MATILVVDDEVPIAELLRDLLEDEGYTVHVAHDGKAALALARRERLDLVLTDVMMPRMDGLHLARLLRDAPQARGVLVILMSAAAAPDLAAVGAAAFLAKPFALDAVRRLIATHAAGLNGAYP